ncbi:hypothetical protein BOTBODRAFT_516327 [Botryobasidium botryosum FD-172 SS1]|uniref:Uncharacterized protein n=1 Tax=Botryobasidium botryosum (strain FD-172 SS1) TaxID=930990 RepID=A0A067MV69_BOTB1|nr:hypothetical protein BOTBODRAFT_516327 [Botryobasidium botryosum FD-172 SS1]
MTGQAAVPAPNKYFCGISLLQAVNCQAQTMTWCPWTCAFLGFVSLNAVCLYDLHVRCAYPLTTNLPSQIAVSRLAVTSGLVNSNAYGNVVLDSSRQLRRRIFELTK